MQTKFSTMIDGHASDCLFCQFLRRMHSRKGLQELKQQLPKTVNRDFTLFCGLSSHEARSTTRREQSLFSFGPKRRWHKNWISNNYENKHFFSTLENDTCITITKTGVLFTLIPEKSLLRCNRNCWEFFSYGKTEDERRNSRINASLHNVFHVHVLRCLLVMISCVSSVASTFCLLSRTIYAVEKQPGPLTTLSSRVSQ